MAKIRYTILMPRTHSLLSKKILASVGNGIAQLDIFKQFEGEYGRKVVYDALFRLLQQGIVRYDRAIKNPLVTLTEDGEGLLTRVRPTRDGVWKIVIFDIPEKKREIRNTLRSKLKTLGFKKWQESIWISPYKLDKQIEEEFKQLAENLFIRLIKTTEINYTDDLENLFTE
jgi:CRISPR-associated endonuclease Cas2